MLDILTQILPLFIIIGFGWLISRFKIATKLWLKPIGDFALFIGFPALIFGNLTKENIDFQIIGDSFMRVSILLLGMLLILISVINWVAKSKQMKATLIICFLFGNAAFLGIPLVTSLNNDLAQLASLNASIMLFWVFSLGLIIVEAYTKDQRNIIKIFISLTKNPLLLSVVLGIGFNYLEISIPKFIHKPIEMTGKAVSPMVMLMIGIFIAENPIKSFVTVKAPMIFSTFKLLIFPIIGLILFSLRGKQELSSIVQFAMPAAITPFAMAHRYNLNGEFICNSIIVSTVLSLFTLPIIIYLFKFLEV